MLITDANGDILQINRSFTEITGYAADEVIGKNPRIFSSGRHDKAFYKEMWNSLSNKGVWKGEIWDRQKNGEVHPDFLTITAVKNVHGAVTNYVATLTDITLRKQMEEKINLLAFYDTLTKLPNRRLLNDRLTQALASSKRNACYGAMMFIDLDNFKPLNDTHGHAVGDLLLVEVARRLKTCIREMDTVARFGGDEFVVMLSELDTERIEATAEASFIAEKIRMVLSEPYLLLVSQNEKSKNEVQHHCTATIGVAMFTGYEDGSDILRWADAAMYEAKEAGRNSVRFYEQGI